MNGSLKRETMSNVDAAWWYMEDPVNLMMVTGLMHFEDPLDFHELKTAIESRLLTFPRFCQRVVNPTNAMKNPVWEEVSRIDLDHHIQTERLPGNGGYEVLRERVSQLMSVPLDYQRPLWRVDLIENCEPGNALVVRTHHCIADGMALVSVLLSLTGQTAEASLLSPEPEPPEPRRLNSSGNIFKIAGSALRGAGKITSRMIQSGLETVSSPSKLMDLAKFGTQSAVTVTKLLLKQPDPKTIFKGPLTLRKIPAWSRDISLADIKEIRKVTKTTVNDVLLTAMTGGLRRYLIQRGQPTEGLNFRASVPVNLRPLHEAKKLGNHFGLVFLSLPVGIEDVLERLFCLKKRMDAIKNSPEAVIALGILKAVGMTPAEIQRIVINIFGAKSTCVMTNVPGPKQPLYLAGKPMTNMMFWVPQSGRIGMGISILSYSGKVRLGLVTDEGLVPDPDGIIEGFYHELDEMNKLVTQLKTAGP